MNRSLNKVLYSYRTEQIPSGCGAFQRLVPCKHRWCLARCPQCRWSSLAYLGDEHIILESHCSGTPVKKWWLSCFAPSACPSGTSLIPADSKTRLEGPLWIQSDFSWKLETPPPPIDFNQGGRNKWLPYCSHFCPICVRKHIKRKLDSCSNKYANSSFLQQWLERASFPPLPP